MPTAASRRFRSLSARIARALAPELTVAEVWAWWARVYLPARVLPRQLERVAERDLLPALGELTSAELAPVHVERLLQELEHRGLAARTVNGRRSLLKRVLQDARANGQWDGPDVLAAVRARRVPLHLWPTLTFEEAARLVYRERPPWRALWALAVLRGLRKGELIALRRAAVQLPLGLLIIERSHERRATKNGRSRVLPVGPELAPILEEHLALMPSAPDSLLFPGRGGRLRRRDDKLAARLRAALARAGVLELDPSGAIVPRRLRLHDLRHTFATLATQAGVRREVVKMALGHVGDVTDSYTQAGRDELARELCKYRLRPEGECASSAVRAAEEALEMGASPQNEASTPERETRFELATLSLGSARAGIPVELPEPGDTCKACDLEERRQEPAVIVIDRSAYCRHHGDRAIARTPNRGARACVITINGREVAWAPKGGAR